eukprot:CAMPEP_0113661362 /NCGR_PEP_ID=MMETSP0017_2-20120614/33387_1 /TAXON_ID=2856 /ORGANISM="Cylindrotheca closterium" /LENGTH=445 /DNA_ID=CAMNT_0000576047 /DNA_START=186 /DNA_END=1526 /DNA_ORIENTATION=+ /assembly_acc=CAM_ASM_000147
MRIRPSSLSTGVRRSAACQQRQNFTNKTCRNHGDLWWRQQAKQQAKLKTRRRRFSTTAEEAVVEEPSYDTLKIVAIGQAIPFIGFGFMDNSILIVAGDAIDTYLGVTLGISTLCAAAIGNIISDLAGIGMGTVIEDFCANRLKLPTPNLTTAQRQLRSVRFAGQWGMAVGMTFGCIVGMFPLLFIDDKKVQNLKKKAHLEALFMDVVTEAKTLVGAESTCLYLRVTQDKDKLVEKHAHLPYCPAADGEFLYAMYYVLPKSKHDSNSSEDEQQQVRSSGHQGLSHQPLAIEEVDSSRFLPLGKGIVSRAVMTGEAWNIRDVSEEPDFFPEVRSEDMERPLDELKHMVVVPVLDYQGRAIGVIRAMNKVASSSGVVGAAGSSPEDGFTSIDVQTLKALASHISVSLNSVYQDQDDEEVRLRDTIRILKEQGIQGKQQGSLTKLFPSE